MADSDFSIPDDDERRDNDEYGLTDLYGTEASEETSTSYAQSVDTQAETTDHESNLVSQLPNSLDTPSRSRARRQDKKDDKDEQVILTYAETLHKGLKIMWVPMVYCGRMPFRLLLKNNRASIKVNKFSPAYIACFTMCVFTWILFIWITLGILLILGHTSSPATAHSDLLEIALARRFWSDTFIFWTTLLQACVSTTHILYQAGDFAMFIKAWYRVLDITKIEVSRTLKQYIIISQITLCIFILGVIVIFCLPSMFISFRGTTWIIVMSFYEPLKRFGVLKGHPPQIGGKHYFQRFAAVGLLVYLIAIIFSWMYIMQFMVFCRCFRKGLKCINQRIAMILNVDDVPRVGPNALRLTYEYIHKDYLGIATTGIKIGRIFSWTICNYYLWAILVLVVELGEIFRFAKRSHHQRAKERFNSSTNSLEDIAIPLPVQHVVNDLLHVLVTAICIFYVSYEGSGAHKEGKMSYELARYKGLVDCSSQLERNFIRSIWIIVSEKCPVHVAPGKFFGITHSTVMTVFATAFTYFVFWAQSQGHFVSSEDKEEYE